MLRSIFAACVFLSIAGAAFAQAPMPVPTTVAPPQVQQQSMQAVPGITPIGSPTFVAPANDNNFAIGKIFGQLLAPYITALIQALIGVIIGWLIWAAQKYLNVTVDAARRAEITAAAQRLASSLVADGAVSLSGKTITVDNPAMLSAVNAVLAAAPDAVKRFGITPQAVADRIVDMIPQVPAVAPAIAATMTTPTETKVAIPIPTAPETSKAA